MTDPWRISALADRHRALGSELEDWNGMGTAWSYAHDVADDHEAIRTRAGLMDVSGLKKIHYVGPHAEPLLQEAVTRDVSKLYPGKCVYATMLDEGGKFIDDCIVYRTGPNAFFVVHGAGAGHDVLTRSALGRDVAVRFDDDLHDLSLQGPERTRFGRMLVNQDGVVVIDYRRTFIYYRRDAPEAANAGGFPVVSTPTGPSDRLVQAARRRRGTLPFRRPMVRNPPSLAVNAAGSCAYSPIA